MFLYLLCTVEYHLLIQRELCVFQVALVHWQKQGVDGFKLSGFERVFSLNSTLWDDIRTIALQPQEDKEGKEKERR